MLLLFFSKLEIDCWLPICLTLCLPLVCGISESHGKEQPFRSSTTRIGRWWGVCSQGFVTASWVDRVGDSRDATGRQVSLCPLLELEAHRQAFGKEDRWVGRGESKSLLGATDNVHAISFCLWPCSCVACKNRTLCNPGRRSSSWCDGATGMLVILHSFSWM